MLLKLENDNYLDTTKCYLWEVDEPLNAIVANTDYEEIKVYSSPDHALLEMLLQNIMVQITKGFMISDVKSILAGMGEVKSV